MVYKVFVVFSVMCYEHSPLLMAILSTKMEYPTSLQTLERYFSLANIASQNWKINDTCLENRAKVAKAAFAHFCGFTKLQSSIFQFCDAMFAGLGFWIII